MSSQLINEYRAELDKLRQVSGVRRESVLREAFKDLLKRWGRSLDLTFIPEHDIVTAKGNRIYVDGALLHGLRVPFGYWEAKDADDKLDDEITDKFRKGYPKDNIIFSDDVTAVLYQDGHEQMRAAMDDAETLLPLLTRFFAHERQEIADFKKAVKQFALDLPAILTALREIIQTKRKDSKDFARAQDDFLKHARDAINPAVDEADVQEMLIQHILTEDIFAKVFENPDFHRQNNVAAALYALEDKLFGYGEKQRLLKALGPYYAGIQSTAAMIESHTEKQGFLKGLYENFYKVYNPMAADRLGVVYTPGEIVRFMIKSADWLCETHFGKNLIDKGVEILDPATGTGTFIVELLEHFRGNHEKLRHKYKEELHANEVAILPYYVANLNIEATYAAITGQFAEYPNLCFVDTLDNVAALGKYAGHMDDMFGSVSDENMARVKRQNERKISVIIGNPPYNAWQDNYNSRNPNRPYKRIDDRIGQTYRGLSNAQNTNSLSDMYVRFWRWASDRVQDEGLIAFVCNRNLIDKVAFDGFRKTVGREFSDVWVVDLGGDVRANPKLSGTKHNVFGIQTGVAIVFAVKRKTSDKPKLFYARRPDEEVAEDKLTALGSLRLGDSAFTSIVPDTKGNWIGTSGEGWDSFLPLVDPSEGPADVAHTVSAVFRLVSNGCTTQRDEWVVEREAGSRREGSCARHGI
jgi:predicted helicase